MSQSTNIDQSADPQADRQPLDFRDYVTSLLTLPLRVRVEGAFCDSGREGDLTKLARTRDGGWTALVENMTPGDDGCPSRYHKPENLRVLDATRSVRG